uniref:Uncharacterized protein n=1 Tax=Arundo donax TaxID=35708 RepID=A0A0A9G4X1_ARUDO
MDQREHQQFPRKLLGIPQPREVLGPRKASGTLHVFVLWLETLASSLRRLGGRIVCAESK